MIEYLEQLVEEKKYREALKEAERLLRITKDPHEIVWIHVARVMSHCSLGEEKYSLAGGDAAIQMAERLGEWDAYGLLTLYVGVAYARLGQQVETARRMYDFLGKRHLYRNALKYEYNAWYNLGIANFVEGESQLGTQALINALKAAEGHGEHRHAHGVRQSLIKASLEAGLLEPIPRLLAECATYLRRNPDMPGYFRSWAYHVKMRGEHALATGRPVRARMLLAKALSGVKGQPALEFLFHALLSRIADHLDNAEWALGHALAARTCAVLSHRSDLESEAALLVDELTLRRIPVPRDLDVWYMNV
ncbi:MAG TPA: hypothetical protein VD902_12285 [Symbiobacteriaceae bacterium]|jgi:tetratricopeptide (TPR) repeat protein|nr:hypothetical protein [Symbiobacteriaceae bacterium]